MNVLKLIQQSKKLKKNLKLIGEKKKINFQIVIKLIWNKNQIILI